MSTCNQTVIEQGKRLSESCIWDTQKNYYLDKGVDAWSESVPFYITSNAFIANQYAKVIACFISDWISENPESVKHPFPILELGAGTGQLSYYLCMEIKTQLEARSLQSLKINYIVSDISKKNLDFIRKHPAMQELIEEELILFSCFDAERDQRIFSYPKLGEKPEIITIENPLISISNYVLDSLTADVFFVKNGQLYESLIKLTTPSHNLENGCPIDWKSVDLSYMNQPINERYYDNPHYNHILKKHNTEQLNDRYFVFPIGSLNAIKNLNFISKNKLFNLFSDKAFTTLEELAQQEKPDIDIHGSFSMMVNLYAICEYNFLTQGEFFLPTSRDGLTTAIISSGVQLEKFRLLRYQLHSCFEEFSPTDFYNLYEHLSRDTTKWELPELVSILALSCWDPGIFQLIADRLLDLIDTSDSQIMDRLSECLPNIAERVYHVPGCDDALFNLGSIYYAFGDYQEALDLYEMSNIYFPDNYETLFNIGLCYYYLEAYESAIQFLQEGLTLNSGSNDCRAQIERAKRKLGKK
jgi:SAM-dependent MidA family methyltransferase